MRALASALSILMLLVLVGVLHAEQARPTWVVIVHPKNGVTTLERKFVEDAFLKKLASWPGGDSIRPADLASDSATRRAFSTDVLRKSVEEVRRYWQQRIFSGREVPPPEFPNDDEVIKFVAAHEGGIGYVSGGANVGSSVKVVTVR